ncbi:MAG: hypothetical protein NT070_02345 [Cyanobacteria bacterium]|nr:hypothetical protein [Cyanobacteriota bacterium]
MTNPNSSIFHDVSRFVEQASQAIGDGLHEFVEQGTETIGRAVEPVATHPITQLVTKVPGGSWLMAALGQVDVDVIQREIAELRRTYPQDTDGSLAQRVVTDTVWKAAGIGLATNFVPPLALMLLAVDLGAIAALQAEMIYRIAAIYGFAPTDPTRRGEVLAIWGLATGSSGVLKAGMSVVEVIPVLGAAVGSAGNAALLFGLGQLACQFYERKQK